MKKLLALATLILGLSTTISAAQTSNWVQIEAHPTLQEAQARARVYGSSLPDIAGFRLGTGWYAIVLGPYTRPGAEARLDQLRSQGRIPEDSYIAEDAGLGEQYWPQGQQSRPVAQPAPTPQAPVATLIDETPREARRSEALLTREEKIAIQEAMKWEGVYSGALDAAFGPGTRRAMGEYQARINAEPTGILTTAQRTKLIGDYRAAIGKLGMVNVQDIAAGIALDMPMGLIEGDTPLSPFSRYKAKNDSGVTAMLISQTGDEVTMSGLYDLMQTLEIIPLEGPRERNRRNFTITGRNDQIESYTYVQTSDDEVKGFTLTWRPEDRRLMERAAQMMQASFAPIKGSVLPDTAGREDQSIDLFAGLEIRRPEASFTGFFVDGKGAVLTSALDQCTRVTIGDEQEAEIVAQDTALGLSLLRPTTDLSPIEIAGFRETAPRLQSEIAVAGYSYGGLLALPALTYGTLADVKGLQGETDRARLALSALPGDAGGPVFDAAGAVIGMLLPRADGARQLPEDVSFAASVSPMASFLQANGVSARISDRTDPIAPEDLTVQAADMAVLVSCWN
ncbi:serine protease [Actibacterium pelagium]|uniref:Peptidoglycan-binding protein n=1 Tax=Actibacterium pelagium TaxID=2029103 RepID=A0A917AFE7_9RHOB|nr:serine protease [Actibacterium pelagium]GGE47828.1 peptidoglycan-binding protein [Actibacterium pelagium]